MEGAAVCVGNENDAWVDGHWSGMCFACGQMWMEERVEEWQCRNACRQMFCGGCNTVESMGRIDNCRYRTREDTGYVLRGDDATHQCPRAGSGFLFTSVF